MMVVSLSKTLSVMRMDVWMPYSSGPGGQVINKIRSMMLLFNLSELLLSGNFVVLWIEPKVLNMLGKYSNT
jgi:hypothetical protein